MGAKCEARVRNKANWPRLEAEGWRFLGPSSTLRRIYAFTRDESRTIASNKPNFPRFWAENADRQEKKSQFGTETRGRRSNIKNQRPKLRNRRVATMTSFMLHFAVRILLFSGSSVWGFVLPATGFRGRKQGSWHFLLVHRPQMGSNPGFGGIGRNTTTGTDLR